MSGLKPAAAAPPLGVGPQALAAAQAQHSTANCRLLLHLTTQLRLVSVAVGRMYTKAGQSYDHGTALAADLKIRPSSDETARVGAALGVFD